MFRVTPRRSAPEPKLTEAPVVGQPAPVGQHRRLGGDAARKGCRCYTNGHLTEKREARGVGARRVAALPASLGLIKPVEPVTDEVEETAPSAPCSRVSNRLARQLWSVFPLYHAGPVGNIRLQSLDVSRNSTSDSGAKSLPRRPADTH